MRSVRDCNVAVVGGAGFLGSHLVNHLIEDRGCSVLVIDNLSSGRREFVHQKAKFVHHDITGSEDYLTKLFRWHGTQFVLNYSAMPFVPDSYERPLRVCDVNFMGALKVINAAQEAGVEAILQVSSAEVYGSSETGGNGNFLPADEGVQIFPHSSYGASKAAIDALVQVRWREAKTPCIALRQFNCIGELETHSYVLPEIISQIAKEQEFRNVKCIGGKFPFVVNLGNNASRDFMYAGDAVKIAVELLERGEFGGVYNLGSETSIKVYDLAKMVGEAMGVEVVVEHDPSRDRAWEIWHLQSDNTKIRNVVQWAEPYLGCVSLEEAIRRTVADFEANGRKWAWQ